MSLARKDDRHNEDLVEEIADGFKRTLKEPEDEGKPKSPGFVITGDARSSPKPRRRDR